ncbi:MAG: excinuclease ABC subunit UvrA [Opitutaceae bacterium]
MPVSAPTSRPAPECIRLRGVRQHNLQGFDLDLPLGRFVVVTGLSGAGKSSLVFDTLHAEGQRRYVETFSAYTRQFLELLPAPRVERVENIRPSIAIEQTNTVRTSRSTVGTMTELTDYAKVWFSHVAGCIDPATGEPVRDDHPAAVWAQARARLAQRPVVVAFRVIRPAALTWTEILAGLQAQGYVRALVALPGAAWHARRLSDLAADPALLGTGDQLFVAQDRLALADDQRARFLEAAEKAYHFGRGELELFAEEEGRLVSAGRFCRGLRSPATGRVFRPATPSLFSFNSPLGACPRCRGFGRILELDPALAIPDPSLSLAQGAIRCWESEVYGGSKRDLLRCARRQGVPTDVPFSRLTESQRRWVLEGEPGAEDAGGTDAWYGLHGFFRWLERNTYKMHVRVFLSRYRAAQPCPDCGGGRLQPEALCWRWHGRTLPELYRMSVAELRALLAEAPGAAPADAAGAARAAMLTRLRYLEEVGLGHLTLDRPSRTLSGGEVARVNLTSCLGTSLVDTLFVLDEPSVGLHPRDVHRLLGVIRRLVDAGNTVVVVEHDEAVIRAADQVIEVGPEPGRRGGRIVFQGSVPEMLVHPECLTGRYLSGRAGSTAPPPRRPVPDTHPRLRLEGITRHNLRDLDVSVPLGRLVCLSGVSGSGKSTLLDAALHQGLLRQRGLPAEEPATIRRLALDQPVGEIVLVDQSPLSRTPRSTPVLYVEAWDLVRELYAATPDARSAGLGASAFSFNGGEGRCDQCQGLGHERVEMQFLSDVFVPCPACGTRRFKPEVLAVRWAGHSIAELLDLTVAEALAVFASQPAIHRRLSSLEAVGLGYLPLGQPLNTLSGGEAQRLKLVRHLAAFRGDAGQAPALLLLDEPTTGLHRHDVGRLLEVLQTLVDQGNSVVVVEHHTEVLRAADWILEVGPEAGAAGGRITAEGTPEDLSRRDTATAPFLRAALDPERGNASRDDLVAEPAPPAVVRPAELTLTGARENNLKDLSLALPHRQLTVVTGVSGSGKSTLAFDILFAEGQRRFMESMSPYARQFVEQLPRPAIGSLTGIPPTVAIEQRMTRGSRKSTVATITEVAQHLRLLYARTGVQHHPESGRPVRPLARTALRALLRKVMTTHPAARRARHLYLCAPLIRGRKGHHQPIADWIADQGYALMRADGQLLPVEAFTRLDRYREHDIEVVVADLRADGSPAPAAALDTALALGRGACFLLTPRDGVLAWFSTTRTAAATGESFPELEPKHFSFNSPRGWCPTCRGHGRILPWMLEPAEDGEEDPARLVRELGLEDAGDLAAEGQPCPDCGGARLNRISRAVRLPFRGGRPALSLPELLRRTPAELLRLLAALDLDARGRAVLAEVRPEISERLRFLERVGLGYLTLDRPTATLSGGEQQRIRLAAQLGSNLTGVLYVLDEPSIGLHAGDNQRLIATLEGLRDKGNTVLVVEHDDELMQRADRIIDLGPGAGIHGGELLACGTPAEVRANPRSLTGRYLAAGIAHPLRGSRRPLPAPNARGAWLTLDGVRFRNLRAVRLRLPIGRLTVVAGPSGAGKSSLIRDLLHPAASQAIAARRERLSGREFVQGGGAPGEQGRPPFASLAGAAGFRRVVEVDQAPIGQTPRSTPATYLGILDLIRAFFAQLPEARLRGYTASRFSFNTAGGRCPACEGAGRIRLEMAFLPDAFLPCDTCQGSRYGPELKDVTWQGRDIGAVLNLTFEEAAREFAFHAELAEVCRLMVDCGLGYLALGQSSNTLSGGEAQRLKLVTELAQGSAGRRERARGVPARNLYLLEEPTIGLHLSDCEKLIRVLHALVDQGHTVVVIEHHLDVILEADHVVELGPGGGPTGGEIVYAGDPEGLLRCKGSPTAPHLRRLRRARG